MRPWERTLAVVSVSQFFAMLAFSFAVPFVPFFIQKDLGVTDPAAVKGWVSLFTAASPLTLAISAPIWGALGDRYGRRIMLLRSYVGGMSVLTLMSFVPNVQALVILRLLQGTVTGTVNTAQAFVSVQCPSRRSGMVLGTLSAAVFSGNMAGAFLGGLFADRFGYRPAFRASGLFLLAAVLLVLLGTREQFVRPADEERPTANGGRMQAFWGKIGPALPILGLMGAMGFVRMFDLSWLPLRVQELQGGVLKGAAFRAGSLAAMGGVAGFLAGPILGRLADRVPPPRIGQFSALGAGLMSLIMGTAHGFVQLFAGRFGNTFCGGGLDPVFHIWLAKTTPPESRGFTFGWAVTAKSVGWMLAPLLSGLVAVQWGLRAVFFTNAAFYLLLIPAIWAMGRRLPAGAAPAERPP